MTWTEDDLRDLPTSDGFRLRGTEMTRLETFVDAAFAFAMTMVVISVESVPRTYGELLTALKGVPAFAACFALIMMFWSGHRNWSRRYGLEDRSTIALSLGLIFVILVYVYPLRLMFSAFFAWMTRGWLPTEFAVHDGWEMIGLFVVYGVGYGALCGSLALLHRSSRVAADELALNAYERVRTDEQIVSWTVQAVTGLASAAFAGLLPGRIGVWAGFIYCTLPVSMTYLANRYEKKAQRVAGVAISRSAT